MHLLIQELACLSGTTPASLETLDSTKGKRVDKKQGGCVGRERDQQGGRGRNIVRTGPGKKRGLLLLLLFGLSSGAVQAHQKDPAEAAYEAAMSFKITGKGHYGQCYVYAGELYNRIAELQVEVYMITYDWEKNGRSGRHSIVVYGDGKGRYWGMDNMSRKPVWLDGTGVDSWVLSFEYQGTARPPVQVGVQVVSYTTNKNPGNVSRIVAMNR